MNWRVTTAVAVTLLFWSSAFSGIKEGLTGYTPGHLVLLRFLTASAVFFVYGAVRRIRLPERRDVLPIAGLAFLGISVYHTSLTFGETAVPAGTASLIIAAAPVFTALFSAFLLRERLRLSGWTGMALGFAGVGVIAFSSGDNPDFTKGALLILVSSVSTAFFFVLQKRFYKRYTPIELTAYFTVFGTVPMLLFAPGLIHQIQQAPPAATAAAIYIGIFPAAVAYVAWAVALSGATASLVASALYVNPVLAVAIAWIWLGEAPSITAIAGGALAIAGVAVTSLWGGSSPNRPRAFPSVLRLPGRRQRPRM